MVEVPSHEEFLASTATVMEVYADGSCLDVNGTPAAGYGVFVESALNSIRICEPVSDDDLSQTSQVAEVCALKAALEVVISLRPHKAVIKTDSNYACNGYNNWMIEWSRNKWRKANGSEVAHKSIWQLILSLSTCLPERSISCQVEWVPRASSIGQEMADALARQACSLHVQCQYCRSVLGRQNGPHRCEPVCHNGSCDGTRTFANLHAYKQHVEACHATTRPCRRHDCKAVFGSEAAALNHEFSCHNSFVHDCDYCDAIFQSVDEKTCHEFDSCAYAPFCRICKRWFMNMNALVQHDEAVH